LPSASKGFAECRTQQTVHDKKIIGKDLFTECFLSGTRQRLCRVPRQHSAKKSCHDEADNVNGYFAECPTAGHSAKKKIKILCRVPLCVALGKEKNLKILCRVPLCVALGKEFFFENSLPSSPLRGTRQRNFFKKIIC
jgi:hypothetical protein